MRVGLGPRFLFEAGFLVAVAFGAGMARLGTTTIIAVMAAAWLAVAGVEWVFSRARRSAGAAAPSDAGPAREAPREWRPIPALLGSEPRVVPAAPEPRVVPAPPERRIEEPKVERVPAPPERRIEEPKVERAPAPIQQVDPEPAPEPDASPGPSPEPAQQPEQEPPEEPSAPETPLEQPRLEAVPPPPPPQRAAPEPVAAEPGASPELALIVPITARVEQKPREWNLWELERLTREQSGSDVVGDEERTFLLMYLREFANADGVLPVSFDNVVRESFHDVLELAGT